jgi:hypothetical protein
MNVGIGELPFHSNDRWCLQFGRVNRCSHYARHFAVALVNTSTIGRARRRCPTTSITKLNDSCDSQFSGQRSGRRA